MIWHIKSITAHLIHQKIQVFQDSVRHTDWHLKSCSQWLRIMAHQINTKKLRDTFFVWPTVVNNMCTTVLTFIVLLGEILHCYAFFVRLECFNNLLRFSIRMEFQFQISIHKNEIPGQNMTRTWDQQLEISAVLLRQAPSEHWFTDWLIIF